MEPGLLELLVLELSRIDRQYAPITVDATDTAGAPAVPSGVSVALLPPRSTPNADTVWFPADYWPDTGEWVVLLAGPDADPTAAIIVLVTSDLWMRVEDSPETRAVPIAHVVVI